MNANDDRGVVSGRWDGKYSDGVAPTRWNGSVPILRRWSEGGGQKVRYGQCWVFTGVACTGEKNRISVIVPCTTFLSCCWIFLAAWQKKSYFTWVPGLQWCNEKTTYNNVQRDQGSLNHKQMTRFFLVNQTCITRSGQTNSWANNYEQVLYSESKYTIPVRALQCE